MIQIYCKGNKNYTKNGDAVIFPTECRMRAKLNDTWEMELIHPIDQDGRWKYIEEEAVIAAPTFQGKKQLFRIDKRNKDDNEVAAVAYPIFFDSMDDCFLLDVRPTAKNGQEALDIMMAGSKYSGQSDITAVSTAYFVRRNLMSAINGEEDPSFISRWGGEILYDNHTVIINGRVGGDYGMEIRYGKNMDGIDYQVDMADVVTRIIPVAYNGHMLEGASPWVDSPNIRKYAKIYTREIQFDDVKLKEDAGEDEVSYDTIAELREELRKRCNELYSKGADLPKVTIKINIVDLSECEEYEEYADIERIGLGDTVKCYNSRLEITTEARAVEIEWDCIKDVAGEIVLGDFEYNYFSKLDSALGVMDAVGKIIGSDGSVMADRVRGFLDAAKTQLRLQNSVAKKQIVRAILFEDLDPESELYGAMALGTQGLQIAKKRTVDNRDWDWTTALTANGLIANCILTGILSDKKGLNTWNLDTGEMNMKVMSIVAESFSLSSGKTIDDIVGDAIDGQTQEDIIDKLTNGGKDQGIFLLDGKVYISLDSLKGRVLMLGGMNNENGEIYIYNSKNEVIGKWNNDSLRAIDVDLSGDLTLEKIVDGKKYSVKIGEITYLDGASKKNSGGLYISPTDGEGVAITPNAFVAQNERFTFQNTADNSDARLEFSFYPESNIRFEAWQKVGSVLAGNPLLELVGYGTSWRKGLGVYMDSSPVYMRGDSGYGLYIYAQNQSTSGWNAMLVDDGNYNFRLYRGTSSSKRYKDISRDMNENDIDKLYHIQPVLAKYKKGILQDTDERFEKSYPMFIAEDVEKFFPEAVDHNADGAPENWNERIMIPAMFQMIKTQKEAIGNLIKRTKKLESMMELEE